MGVGPLNLLLADDDFDDCSFFKNVLDELPFNASLQTVNDGEQLMALLAAMTGKLPDMLFLDLNMPRKNGFECLSEIKSNEKLKELPIIIYSTSFDLSVVDLLYQQGAQYYIRKPASFHKLKMVILQGINAVLQNKNGKIPREKFVIEVEYDNKNFK